MKLTRRDLVFGASAAAVTGVNAAWGGTSGANDSRSLPPANSVMDVLSHFRRRHTLERSQTAFWKERKSTYWTRLPPWSPVQIYLPGMLLSTSPISTVGRRRLWSVLHTPFRVPITGIVLNSRLDIAAKLSITH
jgi:hypothetical protein